MCVLVFFSKWTLSLWHNSASIPPPQSYRGYFRTSKYLFAMIWKPFYNFNSDNSTKRTLKLRLFLDVENVTFSMLWGQPVWPICLRQLKLIWTFRKQCHPTVLALCDLCKSETTMFSSLLLSVVGVCMCAHVLLMKCFQEIDVTNVMFPAVAAHITHIKLINKVQITRCEERWVDR